MIRRIISEVIDVFISLASFSLIAIGYLSNKHAWSGDSTFKMSLISISLISLAWLFYISIPLKNNGRTIGKLLTKQYVVYEKGMKIMTIITREFFISYMIYVMSFGLYPLVIYIYALVKKEDKLWHDKFTNSYVYTKEKNDFEIINHKDPNKIIWKPVKKVRKNKSKRKK